MLAVKVQARGADVFDFDMTLSSPYDTPQRYADAFRAVGKDGVVYGERVKAVSTLECATGTST